MRVGPVGSRSFFLLLPGFGPFADVDDPSVKGAPVGGGERGVVGTVVQSPDGIRARAGEDTRWRCAQWWPNFFSDAPGNRGK